MKSDPNKPKGLGVWGTAKYIFQQNGTRGLYRGVTPRIALGVWQTICMVALGDVAKVTISPGPTLPDSPLTITQEYIAGLTGETPSAGH